MNEEYDVIVLGTGLTVRRGGGPGPAASPAQPCSPRLPRREAGGLLPGRGGSLRAGRACSGACGEGTPRCAKARPGQVPGRVGAVEQGSLGRARPRKPRLRRRCASLAGRGPLAPGDGKEWGSVKSSPVAFPPQLPGPAASQFR